MSFLSHVKASILFPGGSDGLGLVLARKLAAAGHEVVVSTGSKDELDELQVKHPELTVIHGNIATDIGRLALFNHVKTEYPTLSVLILDTGETVPQAPLAQMTDVDWVECVEVLNRTLTSRAHMLTLFTPELERQRDAMIVNMTSMAAICPSNDVPIYSAALAAVHSLTRTLRYRLREQSPHVRVVEVMPHGVKGVSSKGDHDVHADDVLKQLQQEGVEQIGY